MNGLKLSQQFQKSPGAYIAMFAISEAVRFVAIREYNLLVLSKKILPIEKLPEDTKSGLKKECREFLQSFKTTKDNAVLFCKALMVFNYNLSK